MNHAVESEELPRVLMFQGSYYNGRQQFLQSAFREYITVHNYENFIDLDYYFNIFQPDYVILEESCKRSQQITTCYPLGFRNKRIKS